MMAEKKYASQQLDQYIVRFPDGMRDQLKKAAKENNRSLNAEIIHLIECGQASANNQITPRDLFAASAFIALILGGYKPHKDTVDLSFVFANAMVNKRNTGQA